MQINIHLSQLVAALVYSIFGVFVFVAAFLIVDKITPADLYQEICQKQNRAVGYVVGCMSIGISIIIAAAIVG